MIRFRLFLLFFIWCYLLGEKKKVLTWEFVWNWSAD